MGRQISRGAPWVRLFRWSAQRVDFSNRAPTHLDYSNPLPNSLQIFPARNGRGAKLGQLFGVGLVALLLCAAWQPAVVRAETRFIPSAYANGRYDSNIFVAPRSLLPPGQQIDDLVGTVGGRATIEHRSREIDANLTVGGDFNAYTFNTPLNFFTTQVQGNVVLDRLVGRFVKGARLSLYETFRYTPEAPGFATGTKGQAPEDPFLRGIQTLRANTFSNTTTLNALYPVMGRLALQGSYAYSTRRVGSILASTTGGTTFFDTNLHTWSAGPHFQVTPDDSIAILFRQSLASQTRSIGSGDQTIDTNMQSVLADYIRVMPGWRFEVAGGAVLIEPASLWFPTALVRISNNPDRATTVSIQGSRQASPSFFLFAGALISNVGQIEISHRVSDRLRLGGNASYAFNESVPEGIATFQNFAGGAALQYALTRTMQGELFYNYTNLNYDTGPGGFVISRNLVGIALTVEWRGED